jgi:hypothetical protein
MSSSRGRSPSRLTARNLGRAPPKRRGIACGKSARTKRSGEQTWSVARQGRSRFDSRLFSIRFHGSKRVPTSSADPSRGYDSTNPTCNSPAPCGEGSGIGVPPGSKRRGCPPSGVACFRGGPSTPALLTRGREKQGRWLRCSPPPFAMLCLQVQSRRRPKMFGRP